MRKLKIILFTSLFLLTGCRGGRGKSSVSQLTSGSSMSSVTSQSGSSSLSTSSSLSSTSLTSPTKPVSQGSYTLLIYMCGSTLESDRQYGGLMTKSITNMLSVSGQPSDVNIVIETGGASSWRSTYGIRSDKLQRYHIRDQKLILDETLSDKNNMGLSSSLESFIEYGLTNYPADRTSLIFSNHGNAMWGVCFDENNPLSGLSYDWDDGLTNAEVYEAFENAFHDVGRTEKLDFIGYDACLMQMQDIAEFNSHYFNYMIASQESEVGEGWDYANWLDDLYAKKDTESVLKEICDTYITYCNNIGDTYCTLSYLNLNNIENYYNSFESLAIQLSSKINNSNKSSFIRLLNNCKKYGDDDSNYYGSYDVKDFLNKLSSNSTFNPGGNYISDTLSSYSLFVIYNKKGSEAGNSNGLCLFFSTSIDTEQSTYYSAEMTNFTSWRYLSITYGY